MNPCDEATPDLERPEIFAGDEILTTAGLDRLLHRPFAGFDSRGPLARTSRLRPAREQRQHPRGREWEWTRKIGAPRVSRVSTRYCKAGSSGIAPI
jgi:hypothetical protein